jgi:BirA family biotin operon repressor/biotin-[acetyl-CoA-carboxylase] ligase
MRLDPAAEAAGVRIVAYDTIGSTNTEALRLARGGERGPLWITAKSQTAGRGRHGRIWVSEPGNLCASILLTKPAMPERFAELSFVAALALHDAMRGRLPGLANRMALKWPNDILLDGNKVAGILVEAEGVSVVIGMGVNCVHHPAGTEHPATDLAAAGVRATPESLFAPLSAAIVARLAQWNRGSGFAAIRADWLARAAGLGKFIRVNAGSGQVSGNFETIDSSGRLVVRRADGTIQSVAAGDVFLAARQ